MILGPFSVSTEQTGLLLGPFSMETEAVAQLELPDNLALIADLINEVLLYVTAPKRVILKHLNWAVREFCEKTLVWEQDLDAIVSINGRSDYLLAFAGTNIIKVNECLYDGKPLDGARSRDYVTGAVSNGYVTHYSLPKKRVLRLHETPLESGVQIQVRAAVKPTLTATHADSELLNEWQEHIISGAIYKLASIPRQEWTDYAMANFHFQIFKQGIIDAKADVFGGNTNEPLTVQPRKMF